MFLLGVVLFMSVTFSELCQNILPEVPTRILQALAIVESSGEGFVDNRVKIRFEAHLYLERVPEASERFWIGTPVWLEQYFLNDSGVWINVHESQQTEYQALKIASDINSVEAHKVLSIGMFQINSMSYAELGFPAAFPSLMLSWMGESQEHDCKILKKYISIKPGLKQALIDADFETIGRIWNNGNRFWISKLEDVYTSIEP